MAKAIDVANFFINLSSYDEDNDLTNMKLNKLLYFAQGWSLYALGDPIFDENIEAWDHGPVVSSIYHIFKSYGKNVISQLYGEYDEEVFSRKERDFLIDVYMKYNSYSASALRGMTHKPGTPWSNAYIPNRNMNIPKEEIAEYLVSNSSLERFDMKRALEKIPVLECDRNADGLLVIPKEFAGDWIKNQQSDFQRY